MVPHDVSNQTGLFAANAAAAGWWVVNLVARHGPSWEAVPPILIGAASLIGAVKSWQNDQQLRRHREELHRLEIEKRKGNAAG
jgi:hypothetical protein